MGVFRMVFLGLEMIRYIYVGQVCKIFFEKKPVETPQGILIRITKI